MRIPYDSTSSKAECEYLLGVQKMVSLPFVSEKKYVKI